MRSLGYNAPTSFIVNCARIDATSNKLQTTTARFESETRGSRSTFVQNAASFVQYAEIMSTDCCCRCHAVKSECRSRARQAEYYKTQCIAEAEDRENTDNKTQDLFPDEPLADRCALTRSVYPLLFCMKIWGMYFQSNGDHVCLRNAAEPDKRDVDADDGKTSSSKATNRTNWGRTYTVFVLVISWSYRGHFLVISWANAARWLTVFNAADNSFGFQLIVKLTQFSLLPLCAVLQTSYVIAAWTGKLDAVLHDIRITEVVADRIRRRAKILAFSSVFGGLFNSATITYSFFVWNGYDFMVTPLVTHIPVGNVALIIGKNVVVLIDTIVKQSFYLPVLMNYVLSYVLHERFQALNARFRRACDGRGRFDGELKMFRHCHLTYCQAVKTADRVMMLINAGSFCCNMFTAVILLYLLICVNIPDTVWAVNCVFMLCGSLTLLSECTGLGIMMNREVSATISETACFHHK